MMNVIIYLMIYECKENQLNKLINKRDQAVLLNSITNKNQPIEILLFFFAEDLRTRLIVSPHTSRRVLG